MLRVPSWSHTNSHPYEAAASQAFPDTLYVRFHLPFLRCPAKWPTFCPYTLKTSCFIWVLVKWKNSPSPPNWAFNQQKYTLARNKATIFSKIYSPSTKGKATLERSWKEFLNGLWRKLAWNDTGLERGEVKTFTVPPSPPSLQTSSAGDSHVSFHTNPSPGCKTHPRSHSSTEQQRESKYRLSNSEVTHEEMARTVKCAVQNYSGREESCSTTQFWVLHRKGLAAIPKFEWGQTTTSNKGIDAQSPWPCKLGAGSDETPPELFPRPNRYMCFVTQNFSFWTGASDKSL